MGEREPPHEAMATEGICPRCEATCGRDEVDNGIGIVAGPWGCRCGWSEDPHYDALFGGGRQPDGSYLDSNGGYWPRRA